MDIGKTKTAFQEVIRMLSPEINGLLPEDGIGKMTKFYKIERIDGCDIENDGDMLLFQWGIYSFSGQREFQINITRQFIVPDKDEPYQLSLTFYFAENEINQTRKDGSFWCSSPQEIDAFLIQIENCSAFHEMKQQKAHRVELTFEQC